MKGLRYLNVMLTVVAVLLTANLVSHWALTPNVAEPAFAQGIPDAGAQRLQMIDLMKSTNERLDNLEKLLVSGRVRVSATVSGGEAEEQARPVRRRPQ